MPEKINDNPKSACKLISKIVYFAMFLANIEISHKAVLAPLAGISDSSFRQLCKEFGASLVFSEMVSADGVVRENRPTLNYLIFKSIEHPIGIQLFGCNPEILAQATQIVSRLEPDFIDINIGCPVRKVVKRGAGSALLKTLPLIREIVTAMKKSTAVPILAKIRSGWDAEEIVAVEVAQLLEDCGVSAVTVHPRTQSMHFRGHSDWQIITKVKQAVKIPVIGNGDIVTPQDAKQMLDETGCDLIMVGRAAFGNPWIFHQINLFLEQGIICEPPSFSERIDLCLRHFQMLLQGIPEGCAVSEFRKHIGWYTRSMPQSSKFRNQIFQLKTAELVRQALETYKNFVNTNEPLI